MVWGDEFDAPALNTSNWNIGPIGHYPYNHELENYTADNVYLEDGALVLRSQRSRANVHSNYEYTSGRVNSTKKRQWAYGRFCVRAKLPGQSGSGRGLWPAHWLLPDKPCWPSYGEIDIMEMINGDGEVHASMHWNDKRNSSYIPCDYKASSCSGGGVTLSDFGQEWHEYAIEWEPGANKSKVASQIRLVI
jgi:beta-glucanase (GH16 family)